MARFDTSIAGTGSRESAASLIVHHWSRKPISTAAPARSFPSTSEAGQQLTEQDRQNRKIIGIASSTGGPSALASVLRPLPADYPLPVLIVQHITRGFTGSLAEWLKGQVKLKVKTAAQGDAITPGVILLAPDDTHMEMGDRGKIVLNHAGLYKGLRPSANYLFHSLAKVYGSQAVGIILTGMGDDGVEGLVDLRGRGGLTIAQEESSCVVYGMPREAVARGAADYVMTPEGMAGALMQLIETGKGE